MPRFVLCLIPIMGLKPLLTAAIPLFMNLFLNAFFRRVTQLWLHPGLFQHFLISLKGTLLKPATPRCFHRQRERGRFNRAVQGPGAGMDLGAGGKGAPWWLENHVVKYRLYYFIISDPTITELVKDWIEIIQESGSFISPLVFRFGLLQTKTSKIE